jgi:hypothetical protein
MLAIRWLLALALIPLTWSGQAEAPVRELTGRLVDEAGMPIAYRYVWVIAMWNPVEEEFNEGRSGSRVLGKAWTRGDGKFALHLDDLPTTRERKHCIFDLAIDEDGKRYTRYVRLYEDVDLQEGSRQMGQRVAESTLPLATGQVVDERGEVVPTAQVRVVHPMPVPSGRHRPPLLDIDENLLDDAGQFEMRWSLTPEHVALQAFAEGHLPSPVVWVKNGARDVRLEVTRFGSIEGRVRIDDVVARVPGIDRSIALDLALPDDPEHHTSALPVSRDGLSFACSAIPPGRWFLRAQYSSTEKPLVIPFDAHAGREPEKLDIDLRGKVPVRYVDLVDEAGKRIETRWMVEPTPRGLVSGEPHSMLAIVGSDQPKEIFVGADGYRLQRIPKGQDDQRIVLQPGLRVTFHLPAGIELPPKPWRLAFAVDPLVELMQNDSFTPGGDCAWSKIFAFDAPGDVTVILPNAGKCDVWWMLVTDDERQRLVPRRIEIPDRRDPQRIEIGPDAKSYADALAKLKVR